MYAAIAAVSRGVRRDATSGKITTQQPGCARRAWKEKVFQRSESAVIVCHEHETLERAERA
jgi:hypothetical protein